MFFNRIDYPANEAPRGIDSADFDGDGDQDIVVANPGIDPSSVNPDSGNEISILTNNGDGTFAAPVTFTTGVGPRVSVGDFDGDGNIDIATSNATDNTISILLNDGQGAFAAPVDFSTGKEPLINTPADLDGDGDLDLITSNQDSVNLNTAIFTGDTISILRNNGQGEFAAPETLTVGEGVFLVATGDLDGDDDLDIVTANERDDTLSILFNNGADGFDEPVELEAGRRPTSPITSDIDGDGDLDIATSNFGSGDVSVFLNNGDGTFATANIFDTEDSPSNLQAADLDGDGDIDFAMRHSVFFTRSGNTTGSTISILRNNDDGTFIEPEILSVGNTPSGLVVDDFDGEGELDFATPNFDDDSVTVYLNQPFQISGLKFNDLNGNGFRDTDLIQGNNPDVIFTLDVSGSADEPFEGISVGDVNGDGIADTRLDAEIAGFAILNEQLRNQGLGDTADVGIVVFSGNAAQVDLDPATEGLQLTTTPNADNNNNGVLDVVEVLVSINSGAFGVGNDTGTNFEVALQEVNNTFTTLETASGDGNLVFLSDGEVNRGGSITDEVEQLNNLGVNISAFGVGEDASLEDLQAINPDAVVFTSTDELLGIFGNLEGSDGQESFLEPGLAGVSIYLDINDNGELDEDEPVQLTAEDDPATAEINETGQYQFTDLEPGTYIVRELVPEGFEQTSPEEGQYTIELGVGETSENLDFGNVALTEVDGVPVYRFFRTDTQTQFYTTEEVEKNSVLENLPQYELEGISFGGIPQPEEEDEITGISPVYRFFNTSTGIHLYTVDENERAFVEENLSNYVFEGTPYYGYDTQEEGTVPLYRFYNPGLDAHFYTPSIEERDFFLESPDYQPEGGDDGIAFYVEPVEI